MPSPFYSASVVLFQLHGAWSVISLPQEHAAKTDMLSVVCIQVLCTVEEGVANVAYD